MTRSERDLSRLPKWAQDMIRVLQIDLKHAEQELRSAYGTEPTRLVINPEYDPNGQLKQKYGPVGGRVVWTPKPGGSPIGDGVIEAHIDDMFGCPSVRISAGPALRIIPMATNCALIQAHDYRS